MDRREPPSLSLPLPRSVRHVPAEEAPPRLRALRDATPRRRSWLGRLGVLLAYTCLAVACLIAAGATFLMVAAPTEIVRDQIVAQVKARTGRTLEISGPASFTLFPSVGFRLADVSLSAPPGMQAAALLKARRLAVDVRLLPLLQREVVIERLVLGEPVIELTVDREGRRSWEFAADGGDASPVRLAQATGRGTRTDAMPPELKDFVRNASDPGKAGEIASRVPLDELVLADTRIENGTLRYADLRTGARHEARAINATIVLKALSSPLETKGTFDWQGETVRLDARLTTLKAALDGRPATLAATLSGRSLEASYDGSITQRAGLELEGRLSARTPSVRETARWLGSELPASAGFGEASLAGVLKASTTAAAIDALVATLDGTSANGALSVDISGARPLIKANLRIAALDIDRYRTLPADAAQQVKRSPPATGQPSVAATPPPQPRAPAGTGPQSIEDLLERDTSGPQVRGFLQRDGWSSTPLGLGALGLIDADLRLAFGGITSGAIRIGATRLAAVLKAGALRVDIEDSQLYEGRGRGFLTLDAGKPAPPLAVNLQVEGVKAEGLLMDAAGVDTIAGKGRLSLAVAGQGQSEKDIVESLTGRSDFTFADGAIVGWNIPAMIRGLSQGRFSGFDRIASERTDFTELAASFQIAGGIATTKDLRLASPALRLTGDGKVELPARRVDLTLRPKLVGSLAGQGGGTDLAGFEVPIKVQGPWDRPSYAPDVKDILRDPDKAIDAARRLGKQLDPDGKLGGMLRGLLGR